MVRVGLLCLLVGFGPGCRFGFGDDDPGGADAASSDSTSTPDALAGADANVNLLEARIYLDAENVDGNGVAGSTACVDGTDEWRDLDSAAVGVLGGFADPPCGGASGWLGDGTPAEPHRLRFDASAGQFLSLGTVGSAATYTVSAWIRWSGEGTQTPTGGGTFELIPLVSKGTAETDGAGTDVNYWMGISATTAALGTDFEDADAFSSSPVLGTEALGIESWHHVAITYDQVQQRIYVDASVDVTNAETAVPAPSQLSILAIGADLLSDGNRAGGAFDGDIAVVRIFDYALTAPQIRDECAAFAARFAGATCEGG